MGSTGHKAPSSGPISRENAAKRRELPDLVPAGAPPDFPPIPVARIGVAGR